MLEPTDEMCKALYEAQAKIAKEQHGVDFAPWQRIAAKPGLPGIEGLRVALRPVLALLPEAGATWKRVSNASLYRQVAWIDRDAQYVAVVKDGREFVLTLPDTPSDVSRPQPDTSQEPK